LSSDIIRAVLKSTMRKKIIFHAKRRSKINKHRLSKQKSKSNLAPASWSLKMAVLCLVRQQQQKSSAFASSASCWHPVLHCTAALLLAAQAHQGERAAAA